MIIVVNRALQHYNFAAASWQFGSYISLSVVLSLKVKHLGRALGNTILSRKRSYFGCYQF